MTVTELKTGQNYWHARAEVAEVERDKLFRQNAELAVALKDSQSIQHAEKEILIEEIEAHVKTRKERDELAVALTLAKKGVTLAQCVRHRTTGLAKAEREADLPKYIRGTAQYLDGLAEQADAILQRLIDPAGIVREHDSALVKPLEDTLRTIATKLKPFRMSLYDFVSESYELATEALALREKTEEKL